MGKTQAAKKAPKEVERKDGARTGSRAHVIIVANSATAPNGAKRAKEEVAK